MLISDLPYLYFRTHTKGEMKLETTPICLEISFLYSHSAYIHHKVLFRFKHEKLAYSHS